MEADRLVRLDGKWNPVLSLKPAVAGQDETLMQFAAIVSYLSHSRRPLFT